mgnify:CR=1 FL=1
MRFEQYLNEGFNIPSNLKNILERIKKELNKLTFSEMEKKGAKAFYTLLNDKDIVKDEKAWNDLLRSYIEFPTGDNGMLSKMLKDYNIDKEEKRVSRSTRNKEAMTKYFSMTSESLINEDARHWWKLIKQEGFPTLAFYPALQVWLEMDKCLKGDTFNTKVIMFYAALWLVIVSGKYVAGWMKWKKEKPNEYELERSMGKGGLI